MQFARLLGIPSCFSMGSMWCTNRVMDIGQLMRLELANVAGYHDVAWQNVTGFL